MSVCQSGSRMYRIDTAGGLNMRIAYVTLCANERTAQTQALRHTRVRVRSFSRCHAITFELISKSVESAIACVVAL